MSIVTNDKKLTRCQAVECSYGRPYAPHYFSGTLKMTNSSPFSIDEASEEMALCIMCFDGRVGAYNKLCKEMTAKGVRITASTIKRTATTWEMWKKFELDRIDQEVYDMFEAFFTRSIEITRKPDWI